MAKPTIRFVRATGIIATVLVLTLTPVLSAQRSASQPAPDAVRALLQEVQLLRTAIERAVLVNSRMQLSLLRLDSEQERVADLSAVLRGVQSELATVTAEDLLKTQQVVDLRRSGNRTTDPDRQRSLEGQARLVEREVEALRVREQRLRAQESDAMIAVQASEARLSALNSRLDQIDQLLSEPPRRY